MTEWSDAKRIVESLSTAVLLCDTDLRLSYLNPAAESLLSVSDARAIGMPLLHFFIDVGESAEPALREALASGHLFTKREAKLRVGLRETTVDYTVSQLLAPGQDTHLLIEVQSRDRLLRIAREEAQIGSHQALRQLVRGVAHEIKNPLGGIRGAAQLLERQLSDPELQEYTRVIIEEADRLRVLADRMLGPRQLPAWRTVNVHECLERVLSLLEAEADGRIHFVREYDPSLPDIYVDPDQMIQAVLNIGSNALQALIEHNCEQPTLLFRTRVLRQFTIGAQRHRLVLRIDIQDNGPGIPGDIQQAIFYPMVSGRAAGNGLGLSIAHDIIHQHRGLIEFDSQPGRTMFSIYLPMEKPK